MYQHFDVRYFDVSHTETKTWHGTIEISIKTQSNFEIFHHLQNGMYRIVHRNNSKQGTHHRLGPIQIHG